MKKDKEWLKEEIEKIWHSGHPRLGEVVEYEALKRLIEQLGEPETIDKGSLKRLEDSLINEPDDFCLYKDDLLGWVELLKEEEPQQEKVVVPQFVADFIGENFGDSCPKAIEDAVYYMDKFNECHEYDRLAKEKVFDDRFTEDLGWWISENIVLFYKACTNGYAVEKEKLYRVRLPMTVWDEESSELQEHWYYLVYDNTSDETRLTQSLRAYEHYQTDLSETLIKSIDERYWAFAEEVTQ